MIPLTIASTGELCGQTRIVMTVEVSLLRGSNHMRTDHPRLTPRGHKPVAAPRLVSRCELAMVTP